MNLNLNDLDDNISNIGLPLNTENDMTNINANKSQSTHNVDGVVASNRLQIWKNVATFFLVVGALALMTIAQVYQETENRANDEKAKAILEKNKDNEKAQAILKKNYSTNEINQINETNQIGATNNNGVSSNVETAKSEVVPTATTDLEKTLENPEHVFPGISLLNITKN